MIVAGCDVGSATTKAVAMDGGVLLGYELIISRPDAVQSATDVMARLRDALGLARGDIASSVSTGYGRNIVPFATANYSEISCHGRGAHWLAPSVRTVIDGGGQDCKVIRVNELGYPEDFRMNTKCAAGTGKALELMAASIGVDVSELGWYADRAESPVVLYEPCCVLTEIEIRHMVLDGFDTSDLAAGITDIVGRRIAALSRNLGVVNDVCMTGGISKNPGVTKSLEHHLGTGLVALPHDPQIAGAIGAALFAADIANRRS